MSQTSCFAMTFRAIAKSSHLRWSKLLCDADGTLDRSEGVTRFTAIDLHAWLVVPAETDAERARALLTKAEKNCLVGNSLKFTPTLHLSVSVEDPVMLPMEKPLVLRYRLVIHRGAVNVEQMDHWQREYAQGTKL
jgi:hypothetical protein